MTDGSGPTDAPRALGGATAWRPPAEVPAPAPASSQVDLPLAEQPGPYAPPPYVAQTPPFVAQNPAYVAQPQAYPPQAYAPPPQPYAAQPYAAQPYGGQPYGGQWYAPIPIDPALVTALPVEERSYPFFLRAPRWRWWKPLLAALLVTLVAGICMIVPPLIGMVADGTDFAEVARTQKLELGPWGFLGNNVGIALLIPVAMLFQWAFFGQRPKWLSSVQGGFRWGWFGRCVAVILPLWVVTLAVEYALTGLPPDLRVRPYTALLVVGILLTTPFQSAGEEYLMRGLEQRLVASYFRVEIVGWVAATIVSSLTFMALHGAADPWLNLYYFSFGVAGSWIGWKTGGLEASVAIHVVNNLVSEAFMPWTDFSGMFNREVGTADPTVLIQVGVLAAAVVALRWLARRSHVVTRTAPGAAEVARAQAAAASAWSGLPR